MSEEQQYKVWGKILIVARSLLRSVFHARKPEGNFLTSEFNLASLIGANQQELFNTVLAILKDNGLNWNARTKNNLESFLLTLVSISFIEVLLEEFDQIPQVTLTIRVSHATSRETESRTSENQRELTALKYPGWWEDSFAYLLTSSKPFGTLDENSLNNIITKVKAVLLTFKPAKKSAVSSNIKKGAHALQRIPFRLKVIKLKEEWDQKKERPSPFVAEEGKIIPVDCHWNSSKFKWCSHTGSATTESDNVTMCPVAHDISLGAWIGHGQFGSVYECHFCTREESPDIKEGVTHNNLKIRVAAAKIFSLGVDSEAHDNFMNELHMLSSPLFNILVNWEIIPIPFLSFQRL
eukprot:TRINITY_DN4308_c0_g1_i2.p1 TRINITY_DN4308_c0_g1~~TRINITY_DN4308_c0_g1_i2.p1  ORF type:complete len:384 (-),score=61.87 TRINITY_DN4308_c0_g1_i2:630-1682(-)